MIIGWREKVDLPDWGVTNLVAKVDSGARTSAIHVEGIQHTTDGLVSFAVVLSRRFAHRQVQVTCPIKRETVVKSSTGHTHERIVVETTLSLAGIEKTIELTLVSREKMTCRMLLGRTAIEDDFLIDTSVTHIV